MSPRRTRRQPPPAQPLVATTRTEGWDGRDYLVRPLTGATSDKAYRCPGCEQLVKPGTPHVVVWPADDPDATDRRHWHRPCWSARRHRRAAVPRRPVNPG